MGWSFLVVTKAKQLCILIRDYRMFSWHSLGIQKSIGVKTKKIYLKKILADIEAKKDWRIPSTLYLFADPMLFFKEFG